MSEPIVKRPPMLDLEEFERRLRKPLAANQGDDDPLAELARFVGEQEDPYKTVFEPLSRRPAGTLRRGPDHGEGEERGAHEPLIRGDFAAIEAGLLGAARHESGENLSLSEELDGCEEAEGAEHWRYGDPAEGSRQAGPPFEEIRSRRPLYVMAAVCIAGVVGIGASFGLKGADSHQDEIATIRAADGPAKIHPETAAGTEIPDQDASVLGGSPQQPPVAVVNNVEQPADLSAQANVPEAQANPPRAIAGLATGAASVPVPAPPAQAQPQPSAEPLSIADLIEPKKVKTVSVRPDGTLLPNDAPPQVTTDAVPVPAARPTAASLAKAATPKSAARVATTPKTAAADSNGNPQPSRTSVAAKAKRVELADTRDLVPAAGAPQASPASFAVQLAAPGTEQEARETEVRLMKKFAAELEGFHTSIHKAAVGGKPVYRVRVAGFSSRDEAIALCQKLQTGGGNCFVAKN
ncbi:MAG: SPOR domain-containing protein [Pseudomonadota bacterium]|nr:SPOR domain-containing protein [Pseudomonadota bacterium]